MEPVEIFTILERAKIRKLGLICKHGNANAWNEVMCEERAYDSLVRGHRSDHRNCRRRDSSAASRRRRPRHERGRPRDCLRFRSRNQITS